MDGQALWRGGAGGGQTRRSRRTCEPVSDVGRRVAGGAQGDAAQRLALHRRPLLRARGAGVGAGDGVAAGAPRGLRRRRAQRALRHIPVPPPRPLSRRTAVVAAPDGLIDSRRRQPPAGPGLHLAGGDRGVGCWRRRGGAARGRGQH